MKKVLLLCGMLFSFASCVRENDMYVNDSSGEPAETVIKDLPADQSRIRYRQLIETAQITTRVGDTADAQHPYENVPDITNIPEYDPNKIGYSDAMVIKATTSGDTFQTGYYLKDLYVAKSDITIYVPERTQDHPKGTIYVLPGVKNIKIIDEYWNSPNTTIRMRRGWTYKLWEPIDLGEKLEFKEHESALYYYGSDKLIINEFSTEAYSDMIFESHGPVYFSKKTGMNNWEGKAYGTFIKGGTYWFGADVVYEALCIHGNQEIDMTYKGCVYIHNFYLDGNSPFNMNVDYFMALTNGFYFFDIGCGFNINLNNAVLVIDGETEYLNSETKKNIFRETKHKIYGKGNSAVFIQGSVSVHKDIVQNLQVPNFKTGTPSTAGTDADKLAIFGLRHDNITEEPKIYVMAEGQIWHDDGKNTKFADNGILIKESDIDDNFVIGSRSNSDCRADYTWGTQPPSQGDILPPAEHKYSATGLDFNGNYVYISWHSNLPGGEIQGDINHDHGTNKDPNRKDDGYGGPSVENSNDWGGIIDIVRIDNYNPDRADLYIASTVWNSEHKYNYVKYYNDKLYLASTSKNVGAALHVVPVVASEDGVGQTFNIDESYRVSLTGNSANCVEIIDDKYIATISGRTVGGFNWFDLDDTSNQSKKAKNADTDNYGGKFIYDDGTYIYTLHNTDNATITSYDRNGTQREEKSINVAITPYDGKNSMVVKDNKIYVCCGRNGLYVFDWNSGDKIGQSKISAISVDVDDKGYIYVATGGGLAVFNADIQNAGTKEYTTINYVAYTGKGFIYPNGSEADGSMPDNIAKQSANFVRVHNGKVFIAYGMYGLRIYSVDELINKK